MRLRHHPSSAYAVALCCLANVVRITNVAAQSSYSSTGTTVAAQPSCSTTLSAGSSTPSVNPAYQYRLVSTDLTKPRGIIFDSAGNLLVVQAGVGVVALQLEGQGACLTASKPATVVSNGDLNHGIAFSRDGRTLYASSSEALFEWDYDPQNASVTSGSRTLVTGMSNSDHTTRTLLVPNHVDGLILISRGSTSNVDAEAEDISTGHSQIKAFNVTNVTSAYDFNTDGLLLGWGLRNSVGVAEEPVYGGIYSVENSVDQLTRNGKDIHEDNPAEEMNFHGYLNGTRYAGQGGNYGYPGCVSAWQPEDIPNNQGISVGTQFALDDSNSTDSQCKNDRIAPRLVFQAHMAPLDIKFNNQGTAAWITFHGSWDRTDPAGYKLSTIEFANGAPVALSTSNTSYTDILSNADNSKCPGSCFRPVGLAWGPSGNLFMSSDATGEIYLIRRADGSATNGTLPSSVASATSSGGASATTSSGSGGSVSSSSSSAGAARITPVVLSGLWHMVDGAMAYGRM